MNSLDLQVHTKVAGSVPEEGNDCHWQVPTGDTSVGREAFLARNTPQPPAWLKGRETEFALRQIALALQTEDLLAARTLAADYLDQHHTEAEMLRLTALAANQMARQGTTAARLLHDAVAAQSGLTPAVQQALEALQLPDDLAGPAAGAETALAALDRDLGAGKYAEAERLLRYLREKDPAWLAGAGTEIAVREVPLRLALDQQPRALEVFKEIVVRAGAPRSAAFRLVRDLRTRGNEANARLLAGEIVRLLPDEPAVAKLLKETGAPPDGRE